MTTAPVAVSSRTPVREARHWTTPSVLWRALWALWILDVFFLIALLYCRNVHVKGLDDIGTNTAPSIIAAEQIKSHLADMDADAANELLAEPGSEAAAVQAYNDRSEQAERELIQAAEHIGQREAQRQAILQIQLGMGRYEALIQKARDLRNDHNPAFIATYEQAAELLDHTILSHADELDHANVKQLEAGFSAELSRSRNARFVVAIAAVALGALLIAVQLYLFRQTNRVFNIPLVAATVLLGGFMLYSWNTIHGAGEDLKLAKYDAFDSILALTRGAALAYQANGEESRFLLDPKNASHSTQEFMDERDKIAKLDPPDTYQSVAKSGITPASGYLADELRNITFKGELEAAQDAVRTFGAYVVIDGQIRDLERQGKHKDAIALCIGTAPGQSDWAFDQFTGAMRDAIKINQNAFDAYNQTGRARLNGFDVKVAVVSAFIAILCLLGLMARIREYN